ncbi:MAG: sulfotransferase domain-containing protein [Oscillatoria sp. PMC 1076.18]|nr:sulfotransferase domain-containing protein [Oscillatoria sp. PMC 1076.18]
MQNLVPNNLKNIIKNSKIWLRHRSQYTNLYHCCVHKTASQWLQALFCDSRVYRYSGLKLCPNGQVRRGGYGIVETNSEKFPEKTIAGSLHISFENYLAIPKPDNYKTFFVMRDPRDIVISNYFSVKYSHVPNGNILEQRQTLNNLSLTEGIIYTIEHLQNWGLFAALDSWIDAPKKDPKVKLFKYEEITAKNNFVVVQELLHHCDIKMPDKTLEELLNYHSFVKKTKGRQQGEENQRSHFRKGIAGDWKTYFNEEIEAKFQQATRDLTKRLEYL